PFALQQQAVLIAESPTAVPAQRGTAAERRQHEERRLLSVFLFRGLDSRAQRQHPRFSQQRNVLDGLVLDDLEPKVLVPIVVVVQRHAVKTARAGVSGGGG